MEAVDAIIEHLKRMSKQVTTPEEIAQVWWVTYLITFRDLVYYGNSRIICFLKTLNTYFCLYFSLHAVFHGICCSVFVTVAGWHVEHPASRNSAEVMLNSWWFLWSSPARCEHRYLISWVLWFAISSSQLSASWLADWSFCRPHQSWENYSPCETVLHLLTSAVSDQRMPSHACIDTQHEGLGCCVDDSTDTMSTEEGQNKVARF